MSIKSGKTAKSQVLPLKAKLSKGKNMVRKKSSTHKQSNQKELSSQLSIVECLKKKSVNSIRKHGIHRLVLTGGMGEKWLGL